MQKVKRKDLKKIKTIWRNPDNLTLLGIPHKVRCSEDIEKIITEGRNSDWVLLHSSTTEKTRFLKEYLESIGNFLPKYPGEWLDLETFELGNANQKSILNYIENEELHSYALFLSRTNNSCKRLTMSGSLIAKILDRWDECNICNTCYNNFVFISDYDTDIISFGSFIIWKDGGKKVTEYMLNYIRGLKCSMYENSILKRNRRL